MRVKILLSSTILFLISILLIYQTLIKDDHIILETETVTTQETVLLKKDEKLTENGKNKGEVHYVFTYPKEIPNKARYSLTDKNKQGMIIKIYNNNQVISEGRTSQENNYELICFLIQMVGSTEL